MTDQHSGIPLSIVDPATDEAGGSGPRTVSADQDDRWWGRDDGAAKEAVRPAVVKRLQQLETDNVQHADRLRRYTSGSRADCSEDNVLKCPFTDDELRDMAKPIIEARMSGEREYLKRLRHVCMELYGDGVWNTKVVLPGSFNEIYERWLEAGEQSASLSPLPDTMGSLIGLRKDDQEKMNIHNIYAINMSRLTDRGALWVWNPCLQLICEVGNKFQVPPAFFIDHICSGLRRLTVFNGYGMYGNTASRDDSKGFCAVGHMVTLPASVANLVFDKGNGRDTSTKLGTIAVEVRLSVLNIRDVLVLTLLDDHVPNNPGLNDPGYGTPSIAPETAVVLPISRYGYTIQSLHEFFEDKWNLERLFELWERCGGPRDCFDAFSWLWAVWLYEREIKKVALSLQAIDYESVTLSSQQALNRIKFGRARVAQLRKNLASTKDAVSDHDLINAYRAKEVIDNEHEIPSRLQQASKRTNSTARMTAAVSIFEEYAGLDKQAANLMPQLNENLQVVIASISVEDAQASRRNGERSTQLTLLAAIYLPLTLATGIFGMNVKDINSDEVRYWWPIILAAALMLPSVVVISYIFWKGRMERRREWFELDEQQSERSRWIGLVREAERLRDLEASMIENERPTRSRRWYSSCEPWMKGEKDKLF